MCLKRKYVWNAMITRTATSGVRLGHAQRHCAYVRMRACVALRPAGYSNTTNITQKYNLSLASCKLSGHPRRSYTPTSALVCSRPAQRDNASTHVTYELGCLQTLPKEKYDLRCWSLRLMNACLFYAWVPVRESLSPSLVSAV